MTDNKSSRSGALGMDQEVGATPLINRKNHGPASDPLGWQMLAACRTVWMCLSISATIYRPYQRGVVGESYAIASWRVFIVSTFIAGPLFALEQLIGCYFLFANRFPKRLFAVISRWSYSVSLWCDSNATWMRWTPPKTSDPQEMGLWLNSKMFPNGLPEMRVYNRSGERVA